MDVKISAQDVVKLRDQTGAGMLACKNALIACNGDFDKAADHLREQGVAVAAKKASRIASEGAVCAAISKDAKTGALVELNCESDFVANSDVFRELCDTVSNAALTAKTEDVEKLSATKAGKETVSAQITATTAKTGEKVTLRRAVYITSDKGFVESYIHMGGKLGVLVEVATDKVTDAIRTMAHDAALHIAAFSPMYLDKASVPQSAIDHETEIIKLQLKNDPKMSAKPDEVLSKIAQGKLGKFYSENCALEQPFVKDPSMTLGAYIAQVAKSEGAKVSIARFACLVMGEGLEKRCDDLAAEVQKLSNK